MNPGKRTHKSASLRVAIAESLPVEFWERTREIVAVQSTDQGRGEATALLWRTCREADEAELALIVKPEPFADGLSMVQLLKFYAKFRFVPIQQQPCVLLARRPERVVRIAHGL
jgi:hypothetical protein